MGIHSRDYIRDHSGPSDGFAAGGVTGTVCKRLIAVTAAIFVLQLLFPIVTNWLALSAPQVYHGQIWRLVTYAFCHSPVDILHILFNMLFLWWFGKTLESMYGSREFLLFYLAAAVISGLAFLALGLVAGRNSVAIGASGSIMAVMMVYALFFPRQRVLLMGIIPIEVRWLVGAYIVYDLYPVLLELSGQPRGDGVAHAAHLGGLAFGFLYQKYNIRLSGLVGNLRRPDLSRLKRSFTGRRSAGSRQEFKIYDPSPRQTSDDVDREVDAILEKISRSGEESLTDRERKVLKDASKRYKHR